MCCGIYMGRINYHSLYDAKSWSECRQGNLFPVLVGWILFQLYHAICIRWTAGSDILYEEKKIPIPVSTQVLLIVTIMYKLVLVLLGLGIAIFGQSFIHTYIDDVQWVFYLGLVLNVVCVAGMVLFAFHPSLAKAFVVNGSRLLERMKFLRHKKSREEKLAASMEKYNQTADYMVGHFGMLVVVFIITVVQRFSLFAATWFVYKAFGLSGSSSWLIILMQGAIAVAVDMLPLPGGMGISENSLWRCSCRYLAAHCSCRA